ncbi:D-alanyl-D-alanine carboxypeptidase family protein [Demequina capsici]|uniref:D-alanyl-D-alanine carboxypeptidase family protein n=1 Tax=Demequina capsici TaxID=3075620 RepID=A0AA96FDS2_9MICO|nr:D-alanyl-D-alanine carboxypeptidase family protein [Demequina sp. PMTSA13]WNM27562.1 D-alanyl-D-alanine carboxypeptidase family protein [Demequina sp. PMTSA13]
MTVFVDLSTPGRLAAEHAAGYERTLRALNAAGIDTPGTTSPNHAFRSDAEQEVLFRANYTQDTTEPLFHYASGKTDARSWAGHGTWYRRKGKVAVAPPGTSNHRLGDTVDWQDLGDQGSDRWNKAAAVLTDNGWDHTEGARIGESWHWTRITANDKHRNDTLEDTSMMLIRNTSGGKVWLVTDDAMEHVPDARTLAEYEKALGRAATDHPSWFVEGHQKMQERVRSSKAVQAAAAQAAAGYAVDSDALATAVIAQLPASAKPLTAAEVTAALKSVLSGASLTVK